MAMTVFNAYQGITVGGTAALSTATPPAATMAKLNTLVGTISPGNADTNCFITHNMGLGTTAIALQLSPDVELTPLTANFVGAQWIQGTNDPNYTQLIKLNSTAGGEASTATPQLRFRIRRPNTLDE